MNHTAAATVAVLSAPVITIYVRHHKDCAHSDDHFYKGKGCNCRKRLRWSHNGQRKDISAKTRSWATAEEVRRKIEAKFAAADPSKAVGSITVQPQARPTIRRAVELFISDKKTQGTDEDFVKRYERELERFVDFMEQRGVFFPADMQVEHLTEFRTTWEQWYKSSITKSKCQERMRAFFRYCHNARMIDRIPRMSPIKIVEPPTMPLTDEEYDRLLSFVPKVFEDSRKIQRVHGLIQLMRHSGLAIEDAVTLEQKKLMQGRKGKGKLWRIETNRQKTGIHVSVPIQPKVAKELLAVMKLNGNPRYMFWSGNGKVKTALSNWGNVLRLLFREAGFPEGHPHQLRDTFAVDLLQKGVPLEEVSKLLGHESIKTTEKHYAKWVKSRQDRLDSLVIGTWESASV
jgi:integrase/recombinase XerD